jgi:DNA-binding LacI/PurR family transcriptional regulator
MADIARVAGVHVSTVSRALAGSPLVEAKMRERILKIATKRGYVVNAAARNLRTSRTQALSVVIPLAHERGQALTDPFFTDMLGHLADEITQRGYGMHLQKILPPMDGWLPRLIAAQRADGIIVIGQSTEHGALEQAARAYEPLVVWGGRFEQQSYCVVGTDNTGGARVATDHLIANGRRRIVFVGDPSIPEIQLRCEGYRLALKASGSRARPVVLKSHMTADGAFRAMRDFIANGQEFDAVFGATDVIAISAMRAIAASGMSVPDDVAVVGFDDIAIAAHVHPSLTTVRQNVARGSKLLVDFVLRRLGGDRAESEVMPGELIVRESSGARP